MPSILNVTVCLLKIFYECSAGLYITLQCILLEAYLAQVLLHEVVQYAVMIVM